MQEMVPSLLPSRRLVTFCLEWICDKGASKMAGVDLVAVKHSPGHLGIWDNSIIYRRVFACYHTLVAVNYLPR